MKKNHLFLATAIVALAGCSDNTYMGDLEGGAGTGTGAISFNMNTPTLSRASGASAAEKLDYKFKVYGVKKTGSTYSNVFASGIYNAGADYNADPDAYWVWYNASTANTTTSNTADWDYVGAAGTHGTTSHEATVASGKDQTIKYWDYGADQYEFVAYSATVAGATISKYRKDGFTVTATPAQLAGLYVADKLTINTKNNNPTKPSSGYNQIGNIVQFTFRAAGAKVRLGIYETIPGYAVQNVKFRPNATEFTETTDNAKLSGSFNGTSSSTSGTYDVTYNPTTGIAEFDASASASNYFDFGSFASATPTPVGESSIAPMWASGSADYQNVLPNTDNPANMILYVDYDLYNSVSGETIHVKGAKAVVPSMYMTWNPNYAYTYLFKISDNTNGTTGTQGTSPEGLFPITFDALTIAAADGLEVGSITTVSTPSITTYQNGSVSAAGITYANANGLLYITVNTDGTLATLNASGTTVKLYTVAEGTTEADLMLASSYAKTDVTTGGTDALTVQTSNATVNSVTFSANQYATFTPTANTTYAFEYSKDAVATTYVAATGTYVSGTKYYTDNTGATEVNTTSFEEGVTDVSSYYIVDVAGTPAVKAYKIVKVVTAAP